MYDFPSSTSNKFRPASRSDYISLYIIRPTSCLSNFQVFAHDEKHVLVWLQTYSLSAILDRVKNILMSPQGKILIKFIDMVRKDSDRRDEIMLAAKGLIEGHRSKIFVRAKEWEEMLVDLPQSQRSTYKRRSHRLFTSVAFAKVIVRSMTTKASWIPEISNIVRHILCENKFLQDVYKLMDKTVFSDREVGRFMSM